MSDLVVNYHHCMTARGSITSPNSWNLPHDYSNCSLNNVQSHAQIFWQQLAKLCLCQSFPSQLKVFFKKLSKYVKGSQEFISCCQKLGIPHESYLNTFNHLNLNHPYLKPHLTLRRPWLKLPRQCMTLYCTTILLIVRLIT